MSLSSYECGCLPSESLLPLSMFYVPPFLPPLSKKEMFN